MWNIRCVNDIKLWKWILFYNFVVCGLKKHGDVSFAREFSYNVFLQGVRLSTTRDHYVFPETEGRRKYRMVEGHTRPYTLSKYHVTNLLPFRFNCETHTLTLLKFSKRSSKGDNFWRFVVINKFSTLNNFLELKKKHRINTCLHKQRHFLEIIYWSQ